MNLCTVCQKPATGGVNVAASAASSVPSRFEMRCDEHNPYRMTDTAPDQQQPTTPASDALAWVTTPKRMTGDELAEIQEAFIDSPEGKSLMRDGVRGLLAEIDHLRAAVEELTDERDCLADWRAVGKKLEAEVLKARADRAAAEGERDDWTRAWHEMTEIVASHHSKLQDSRAENARIVAAIEHMDTKMTRLSADGEFVTIYQVMAGPWHRVLGLARGSLALDESPSHLAAAATPPAPSNNPDRSATLPRGGTTEYPWLELWQGRWPGGEPHHCPRCSVGIVGHDDSRGYYCRNCGLEYDKVPAQTSPPATDEGAGSEA